MKNILTERQNEILSFIHQFREENGYPPTLREIGKKFGISSTFGVKRHLEALVKKGFLTIESNASRGINLLHLENNELKGEVIEKNDLFDKVPIVGRVAAGSPILAMENIEGSIVIDPSFVKKSENCFALKVKGDSMVNIGIFEDDMVIVQSASEVNNGDIVVARIFDEVTVKTYSKKNDKISLIPENPKYNPIQIDETIEFSIVGKVTGVVRWIN
jgi:repressor LexA